VLATYFIHQIFGFFQVDYAQAFSLRTMTNKKLYIFVDNCLDCKGNIFLLALACIALACIAESTCCRLWHRVPSEYRNCVSYSDFWDAYQKVLPHETHHAVGKESGQVSHIERWYCTLRQHQARYVLKTLSFSKRDAFHHMVTKWFIVGHNLVRKQFLSLTL
jgi:IS1 family transposase